jgi:[ribosomal protein S18]-alanine N-acetyltransferase
MSPNDNLDHVHIAELSATKFRQPDVVDFLFKALEQYGDAKHHIQACMDYVYSVDAGHGGEVFVAYQKHHLLGAVIVNRTGMSGFIPENILVYIAVDPSTRGLGIGKRLMDLAIEQTPGDIALHMEPDNPARRLYERLGFTSKYIEMRLHKTTS